MAVFNTYDLVLSDILGEDQMEDTESRDSEICNL